jgi:hypothetical protein
MRLNTETRVLSESIKELIGSKRSRSLAVLAICVSAGMARAQWSAVDLDAAIPGNTGSYAFDVWESRLVGFRNLGISQTGALWTDTVGGWTEATDGIYCGGVFEDRVVGASGNAEAYIWGWNGTNFPSGLALGSVGSVAEAIRGNVVVGELNLDAHKWVLGTNGTFVGSSLRPAQISQSERSFVVDTDGLQHVGWIGSDEFAGTAALWIDDAGGYESLHPDDPDLVSSRALGVDNNQQVGFIDNDDEERNLAVLWNGVADDYEVLSPDGVEYDNAATAIFGGIQVGYMTLSGQDTKATLWRGDAASALDLHQYLPAGTTYDESVANAIWAGPGMIRIAGTAWTPGFTPHAIVWTYECAADFAAPWGQLNFFDMTAYLDLYQAGDPQADIAAPFGTLNFFDVSAYVALFDAGCP